MKYPRILALLAICCLLALAFFSRTESASALTPVAPAATQSPPAGLSVDAKDAPFGKGFDFRFRSDSNATTTMSLDPLGHTQSASGSISSKSGSISLSGRYDRSKREIEITARRGGQEIGEYRWRVEAVLR